MSKIMPRGPGAPRLFHRMEHDVSKWPKLMLMTAATSAWLIYDITTSPEAPSQALAVLQYSLLACALFGLVGSMMMYVSEK
jgi:hypothetical protein